MPTPTDHDTKSIVRSCEVCRMFRRMLTTHGPADHARINSDWHAHFEQAHGTVQVPATPQGGWKN